MGLAGGYSDGRDIGVVFNYPNPGGAHALPMCGGVGAQYTPAAGWAQAIAYKQQGAGRRAGGRDRGGARRRCELRDRRILVRANNCDDTTLPLLIYIEDNGYGISVPSEYQTPGSDIAANLASFEGLTIFNGDGTDPDEAERLIGEAIGHVRTQARARVDAADRAAARGPQLPGHADLQVRSEDRGRMGARSAAQAQGPSPPDLRSATSNGRPRARGGVAGRGRARRSRGARRVLARDA